MYYIPLMNNSLCQCMVNGVSQSWSKVLLVNIRVNLIFELVMNIRVNLICEGFSHEVIDQSRSQGMSVGL